MKKIWGTESNNNPKSTSLLKAHVAMVLPKETFHHTMFLSFSKLPILPSTCKLKNKLKKPIPVTVSCLTLITCINLYFYRIYPKNNADKSYTKLLYHTALNTSSALTILDDCLLNSSHAQRCLSIIHFPFINCWKCQST